MTEPDHGILAEVRRAGYNAGFEAAMAHKAQLSQMESDDLIAKGRAEAEAEAPSRFIWWLLGWLSGLFFVWLGWCAGRGF